MQARKQTTTCRDRFKAAKYEIQKPSTWFVASFRRCLPFFTLRDQLDQQQKHLLPLKKVVAKSRARVYFEQQILALLLVLHQTHNLSRNKFARALANQPINQSLEETKFSPGLEKFLILEK